MAEPGSKAAEERLKRFVKHVHLASQKAEQREKARKELQRKVQKIQRLIGKKGVKKETIATAIEDFDDKLNEVLTKENRILLRQEKEELSADKLRKQIQAVRESIGSASKYDIETLEMLKNQVKGLETELRKEIVELRLKVNEVADVRAKRIEELEEKIRQRVGRNYDELLKIEKQLGITEELYKAAKLKGASPEQLSQIKEKMEIMREKVGAKKAALEIPVEKPPFRVPKGTPMIEVPKEKPAPVMKKKPLIKHEMMFGPPPKAKPIIPAEEEPPIGMPPMPRLPELGPPAGGLPPPPPPPPIMRRPAPPRRGFFRRLLGM